MFADSAGMKSRMKSVFNLMFDYALEHEIINRNPARAFEISKDVIKTIEEEKVDHITFTDDEMKTLWNHRYEGYVDMVLDSMLWGLETSRAWVDRIEKC